MHGLINRSIQCFLRDTYGAAVWSRVSAGAGLPPEGFETMLAYDAALTDSVIDLAAQELGKPRDALLEDLGIYLVSLEPLRRLLRFGGLDYVDFLHSLDELAERAHLAVPELNLPDLRLIPTGAGRYRLCCARRRGYGAVFAGILRAMADDYGALALIDAEEGAEAVAIELLQAQFAEGRRFDLAIGRVR
ncbi:heme NO-binding domain-containing protein [Defluviimonas sp. WL0002]|uniref:Heme NO-binding domain-containing protein n=1 Tax=Albidovulum marisflavi TaxID=2984159 RepID=A0ABT2ZCI9_9RHOB|nr:heme NO-binding domain-containing protein [Defluviimonas sp. WL0002]MCV2868787.1 heme NO-binding domain-containing protein [Defluviimonas sp. WL0002]